MQSARLCRRREAPRNGSVGARAPGAGAGFQGRGGVIEVDSDDAAATLEARSRPRRARAD